MSNLNPAAAGYAAARPAWSNGLRACADAVSRLAERLAKSGADRRLRAKLAELDDNLLVDIGIQPDEIHRIRRQDAFMPREWAQRLSAGGLHLVR